MSDSHRSWQLYICTYRHGLRPVVVHGVRLCQSQYHGADLAIYYMLIYFHPIYSTVKLEPEILFVHLFGLKYPAVWCK